MSKSIEQLQAENAALRACALKYIDWLNVDLDPELMLEQDMRDPEMVGSELAGKLAQSNEGGE